MEESEEKEEVQENEEEQVEEQQERKVEEQPKRKRGRPKGTKNKTKKPKAK